MHSFSEGLGQSNIDQANVKQGKWKKKKKPQTSISGMDENYEHYKKSLSES